MDTLIDRLAIEQRNHFDPSFISLIESLSFYSKRSTDEKELLWMLLYTAAQNERMGHNK